MAKVDTYSCDSCGTQRKTANHWFCAHQSTMEIVARVGQGKPPKIKVIVIQEWDDEYADRADVTHHCGLECLNKFVNRVLSGATASSGDAGETGES